MFWYRLSISIASSLRRNPFVISKSLCIKSSGCQIIFLALIALIFITGCKEKYDPVIKPEQTNFLVVEGFINTQGSTDIALTLTSNLRDTSAIQTEQGAVVTIMGEDNTTVPLYENGAGHYQSDSITLSQNQKYRLLIKTAAGKEYASDYIAPKQTPPIDDVNWQNENDGVHIYVNSHGASNNSRYYKWTFEETWEINSRWRVLPGYVNGSVSATNEDETDKMFYCWKSQNSTGILLGSTVQLSDNVISMAPIVNIPRDEERLAVRYSILVKQVSLDRQAYDFYQIMKKNTEATGSIFAPLPTDLSTNIHCVSSPAEKVIGFMSVSTEESKRIFITNAEVAGWHFQSACESTFINVSDTAAAFFNNNYIPYSVQYKELSIVGYYSSSDECMDCRTRGSNVKPSFW